MNVKILGAVRGGNEVRDGEGVCQIESGRRFRSKRLLAIDVSFRYKPASILSPNMPAVALAPPEENQLVRIRGQHWVVSNVRPNALDEPQHLVELTSVDDDDLGRDLTVVWEVEPDARILEKETFPTPQRGRFDDPERLAAFLDAIRWGAVNSADSRALQAPFRSGITIEDYQLDPVVRALSMPRVNLLIADDVGLGKTIEAGLVIQEMLLRQQLTGSWARTVLDINDPITQQPRPVTFDHAVAEEADDVVLAHLNHPLVGAATRLLRAAIWEAGEGRSGLSRVTARVAPDDAVGELLAVVIEETKEREIGDMRAVLTELARTIEAELQDPKQFAFDFDRLDKTERTQVERDLDALRARVAAIPDEIEAEAAEIRHRYSRRTPCLFPAALTFIVPRRLCVEVLGGRWLTAPRSRIGCRSSRRSLV